jgi:hypothetical protein
MTRTTIVVGIAVLVLVIGGIAIYRGSWNTTPIGQITAHPQNYSDQVVTVRGKVTGRFTILGYGGYMLKDDTGEIFIKATVAPAQGDEVTVEGKVNPLLQTPLGDLVILDATQ